MSDKPEYIYAYRRKNTPFKTKISRVAAKHDLYVVKDKNTGKKSDGIEKMFAWLEGLVAPTIKRIVGQDSFCVSLLSNEEKVALADFVSFLHTRNLSFQKQQKNIYSEGIKMMMKTKAEDKEAFEQDIKNAQVKIKDAKEVEDLRQSILNFDKHFKVGLGKENDDYFLKQALLLARKLSPIIFRKEWHLIESNSSRVFVTSDNPVILICPENLSQYRGVGFVNGDVAIPLSPHKCLLLTNNKSGVERLIVGRDAVDSFNEQIMFYAHKFIYSDLLSKDTQNTFDETEEGASEQIIVD